MHRLKMGNQFKEEMVKLRNQRVNLRALKAVKAAYKGPDMRNHIICKLTFGRNEKSEPQSDRLATVDKASNLPKLE